MRDLLMNEVKFVSGGDIEEVALIVTYIVIGTIIVGAMGRVFSRLSCDVHYKNA